MSSTNNNGHYPLKNGPSIVWENLCYETVEFGKFARLKRKIILRRLNGAFNGNSLNAIMGPSGAGKTTLLNCLAGNRHAAATSRIWIKNGVNYFIEQHVQQHILGRMKVGHILDYAFKFKNVNYCAKLKEVHIENMLKMMQLPKEILEQPFDECSGGEQKRIAIAQELMTFDDQQREQTRFLFVDEPTTGLDSLAALQIVRCLKQLAHHGMTVIVSIHAPNNEILKQFDQLYLLVKGGLCIYSGQPTLIQSDIPELVPQDGQPPIEAAMKLACNGIVDPLVATLSNRCRQIKAAALAQQHKKFDVELTVQKISSPKKLFSITDFWHQLCRLFQLTFVTQFVLFIGIAAQILLLCTIVASFFPSDAATSNDCVPLERFYNLSSSVDDEESAVGCLQSKLDEKVKMNENCAFLGYSFIFAGCIAVAISISYILPLVKIFQSEHRNHWYSLGVFYSSTTLIALVEITIYALLLTTANYFISNQHAADGYTVNWQRFLHYSALNWLLCFYMQSIGLLIGTVLSYSLEVAILVGFVVSLQLNLLNPFIVNIDASGNEVLIALSNMAANKFLAMDLPYIFYGIDRCQEGKEYSLLAREANVYGDTIYISYFRVLINALLVRLITLTYLYFKFTLARWWSLEDLIRLITTKIFENDKQACDSYQITIANPNDLTDFEEHKNVSSKKILIAWRNLNVFKEQSLFFERNIASANSETRILSNLNGNLRLGQFTCLMGASGAGKTTLLKVLDGGRKNHLSSSFYLSRWTAIRHCFIPQLNGADSFLRGLTVGQSLLYASKLKNLNLSLTQQNDIVQALLAELGLTDVAHTKVEHCSGGELKRLALGLELTSVQMPNLICIDEPTSGLDSNSAQVVISALRQLVKRHNIAIIASIHQPNCDILNAFDHLYVLALGGVCIYSGCPDQIPKHLDDCLPEPKKQQHAFPVEKLIEYSHGSDPITTQRLVRESQLAAAKCHAELINDTQLIIEGIQRNRNRFHYHSVLILCQRYWSHIIGYLWKEWLAYLLVYLSVSVMLVQLFSPSIIYPSGCVNLAEDDLSSTICSTAANNTGDLAKMLDNYRFNFQLGFAFGLLVMMQTMLSFRCDYFSTFKSEHRNGWYSSGAFYLTKTVFEIVHLIPLILLHSWICNIFEPVRPGIYWKIVLVLALASIANQGLAHISALIVGHLPVISLTLFATSIYFLFIMLSNFFLSLSKMNYFYRFLANFSIPRFSFEALILLQYGFDRCPTDQRSFHPILYMMGIEDVDYYHALLMLVANIAFYRLVAIYLLVKRVNTRKTNLP